MLKEWSTSSDSTSCLGEPWGWRACLRVSDRTSSFGSCTSVDLSPRKSSCLVLHDASVAQKRDVNTVAKRAIGVRAASLVGPDDFVYIDAGTSTMQLAEAITQTEATYFTNSIPHAQLLLAKGCKTYLPGGMVKPLTEALVGEATIASLENLHFTLGFWGTNGISREAGFTTPEYSEARVKEVSMVHTLRRYVLADQSKFDQVSLVTFASFEDATILTDRLPQGGSFQDADNVVEVGSSS